MLSPPSIHPCSFSPIHSCSLSLTLSPTLHPTPPPPHHPTTLPPSVVIYLSIDNNILYCIYIFFYQHTHTIPFSTHPSTLHSSIHPSIHPPYIHPSYRSIIDPSQHPIVNAAYVEGGIKYNKDVNVAMAVAIDGGLITPTIIKAQEMDLFSIGRTWKELVDKAKSKKLSPAEYSSGTFTISNLG